MYSGQVYYLNKDEKTTKHVQFSFISKGKKNIFKLIEYFYLGEFDGKEVYNLGFGDWNPENNEVIFTNNSNNGDVYKVFGTVLHSIELFFGYFFFLYL